MLTYAMVTNGGPGRCFQQQDLDVNGVDANSGNEIPPCCSGFNVQRSKRACFAREKGTSSYMNPVAIFLISLFDKDFEFPNFQVPPTLAWRVSAYVR
jgi:hypothetical protein